MNTFLIILYIVIVLGILLAIGYIYFYNKFNESIIRIDEAEVRIDSNLREKYDLLDRVTALTKKKVKVDNKDLNELMKLKARKISNFDMDRRLVKFYNEFLNIYEKNITLREDDDIYKINKQIELIDEELFTLRNYYNANILNYNKMIKKIPTNIIAKIKKYKERLFYDLKDMKDEDYDDFKL